MKSVACPDRSGGDLSCLLAIHARKHSTSASWLAIRGQFFGRRIRFLRFMGSEPALRVGQRLALARLLIIHTDQGMLES